MKTKFHNHWKNEKFLSRHKWEWYWHFSRYCFCPMWLTTPNRDFIPFAFEIEDTNYEDKPKYSPLSKTRKNFHFTILNFDWRIYK